MYLVYSRGTDVKQGPEVSNQFSPCLLRATKNEGNIILVCLAGWKILSWNLFPDKFVYLNENMIRDMNSTKILLNEDKTPQRFKNVILFSQNC